MPRADSEQGPFQPDLRSPFGWLSSFYGLLLVAYLWVMTDPDLIDFYRIPEWVFDIEIKASATAIFFIFLIYDAHRWGRERSRQKDQARRYREEVEDLWNSRKQLQYKAHTYAGHADKLKLFISDKLLEYIEYDEKFLHFKSIAAEVRHNGVICFDKVQSALESRAAALGSDEPLARQHRDALDQLRYLWDLLDLATADNIALHIANQLCDMEEQYYQRELNPGAAEAGLPPPDFSPARALVRALLPLLQDPSPFEGEVGVGRWVDDPAFYIELAPCDALLGNENHWVLLFENLLKNAQFFSGKRPYRHKHRRIAVKLDEVGGHARIRVFNGGPPIPAADREKIFQLGYSTRRVKEHHGKGLGLFFVGEIVKGYEGRIGIHNRSNEAHWVSLRVTLENGRVATQMLEVVVEDDVPAVRHGAEEPAAKQYEWQYDQRVTSVEVSGSGLSEPHALNPEAVKGSHTWLEPGRPERPSWSLEVHNKRRQGRLVFAPLDVRGVEFVVEVPLAETRLRDDDLGDHPLDLDVDRLNAPFESFGVYHDTGQSG